MWNEKMKLFSNIKPEFHSGDAEEDDADEDDEWEGDDDDAHKDDEREGDDADVDYEKVMMMTRGMMMMVTKMMLTKMMREKAMMQEKKRQSCETEAKLNRNCKLDQTWDIFVTPQINICEEYICDTAN